MSQAATMDGEVPAGTTDAAPADDNAPTKVKVARWVALDAFRFVAVFLMVQGHVFATFLDGATKAQSWYPHHSFVHGYTAPMFLFGAGLAFGYTTFRKWDEHASGGPAVRKRFVRYGWLFLIGYALHLPTLSVPRLFLLCFGGEQPERLAALLRVDVLQHIAFSLVICQTLVFVVKKRRIFVGVVAALAVFFIAASPWVSGIDLTGRMPIGFAGYLNASTGSPFPVMPWAGFTYVGILVAYAVGVAGRDASIVSRRARWPFLGIALTFMLVPIGIDRLGPLPWPPHNFWQMNPLFFFWRLGNVMLILSFLCFAERLIVKIPDRARLWIKVIAAESLIIYVAHIVAIHGSVLGLGLKHTGTLSTHSHNLIEAIVVALGLFAAMALLARVWNWLKAVPKRFRGAQLAMFGAVVVLMIYRA